MYPNSISYGPLYRTGQPNAQRLHDGVGLARGRLVDWDGRARLNVLEDSAIQGAYAQWGAPAQLRAAARVAFKSRTIPGRLPSLLRTDLARGTVVDGGAGLEDEDARRWRPPPSRAGTGGERRSGAGNG